VIPIATPALAQSYRLKRAFDLCIGIPALVVTAPLMLGVWVLVSLLLGRPALFRQERPGQNGEQFTLLKFRTMTDKKGPDGALLPDEQRITRFGRILRSTSLDELPELLNVVRGEMSIVGPRPLLIRYLNRYTPFQMRRHEVRPGITGWAQVNGRNTLSWDEKFAMDVWYVEHQSLWLDVRILLQTLWTMLRRDGIDEPGKVGASEFIGSAPGTSDAPVSATTRNQ
jgi:lipopolysaccharide/colanic/teichoic acid biosynthesis glycosyltransferase